MERDWKVRIASNIQKMLKLEHQTGQTIVGEVLRVRFPTWICEIPIGAKLSNYWQGQRLDMTASTEQWRQLEKVDG